MNLKILAVGSGLTIASLLSSCAGKDNTLSVVEPQPTTEITTVSEESESDDIEYIYCDNYGVVHNIWELSYDANAEPPYHFEYRHSNDVVRACDVDKETGDNIINTFYELEVKDYTAIPEDEYNIPPSSVTYKTTNSEIERKCYPPAEAYDKLLKMMLEINDSIEDTITTE
jgi:hypothetical protein